MDPGMGLVTREMARKMAPVTGRAASREVSSAATVPVMAVVTRESGHRMVPVMVQVPVKVLALADMVLAMEPETQELVPKMAPVMVRVQPGGLEQIRALKVIPIIMAAENKCC